MIKKNDVFEVTIEGMTTEGSGVARVENVAVFVANSAIGDVVSIVIIKVSKKYAIGKILDVIKASEYRQEQDCNVFNSCGGCVYRHIKYSNELEIKKQNVLDSISRIGGIKDFILKDIQGAENINGYRNKAQLPVAKNSGAIEVGFYAYKSHRVIPVNNCKLQPVIFGEIIELFIQWTKLYKPEPYDEVLHKGKLRHLYIRYGENTGEIMVCLIVNGNGLKGEIEFSKMLQENIKGFKTLVVNTNTIKTNVILGNKNRVVIGEGYITDMLCGLRFKISPLSFYQVNAKQAEKLYNKVMEYADLSKESTILDLYCGTGTIGLTLANKCKKVIGAEIIEQAVNDAKENAINNGITNANFICADARKVAETIIDCKEKIDVVIVDPPRKGCSVEVINTISKISPQKIVYVSCDPATLARDLKIFTETYGYSLVEVTPFDLFPRTKHVECVALMLRVEK